MGHIWYNDDHRESWEKRQQQQRYRDLPDGRDFEGKLMDEPIETHFHNRSDVVLDGGGEERIPCQDCHGGCYQGSDEIHDKVIEVFVAFTLR